MSHAVLEARGVRERFPLRGETVLHPDLSPDGAAHASPERSEGKRFPPAGHVHPVVQRTLHLNEVKEIVSRRRAMNAKKA
jgi:hypothetical protein